jgi:Recombinase
VIAEIFDRFLSGSGYKEIADHLNRPGGPPPPGHVDTRRNTAGKWSKNTLRAILQNPVYTGRLFWNRLDFRAVKQGEGPLVRRKPEEWVEATERHHAVIGEEQFERVQAEIARRGRSEGSRRRGKQKRSYLLRGVVQCATGHNPLRMHGKSRKGITYYACCYRISYGDKAAEALGHGKWQYVREDALVKVIDAFFASRVFGPRRLAHFRAQHKELAAELREDGGEERGRIAHEVGEIEQRIQRQLDAIENGVDPVLIGDRIRALKQEREVAEAALAELEATGRHDGLVDLADACSVLDGLPDLGEALTGADPELRRAVFDAFRLSVEIDRNAGQIRLKALVSSAFSQARDLKSLVANGGVAGAGFEPATFAFGYEPAPEVRLSHIANRFRVWLRSATLLAASWPISRPDRGESIVPRGLVSEAVQPWMALLSTALRESSTASLPSVRLDDPGPRERHHGDHVAGAAADDVGVDDLSVPGVGDDLDDPGSG